MAVTYMQKLEQEPETYDSKFTNLTKGVNTEVHNWILKKVNPGQSILEVGCGTGTLASKIALKGGKVRAIDKNFQMINYAMKNIPEKDNIQLLYQIGSIRNLKVPKKSQDLIISTFMLSELRPLEQQIFLRNAWNALKPKGRLIIAAEFIPSGFWKIPFGAKRWFYNKKLRRLNIDRTKPLEHFYDYLEPIGFKIIHNKEWSHGSIRVVELEKNPITDSKPGYYSPEKPNIKGISSQLKIWRCLLTGQVDNISVEPGLYKSGDPDEKSPIIATANYVYTFIKVMRELEGIDAWVLCVDSNGINVWCAARGNDFGNKQLIEAIEGTGLQNFTKNNTIVLPQLSAGGVSKPNLPEMSEKFPFKIKYGPVWAKYLKEYLTKGQNKKKPETMKRAKFTLRHRIRAGITHTTFLMRKVFLLPILTLLVLFFTLDIINIINKTWMIGDLLIWIFFPNLILTFLYPISQFTRNFIMKSVFFGILNIIFLGIVTWFLRSSFLYVILNFFFFLWIGFFTTMSFSGYTMSTNPREIREEYPLFKKLNYILLSVGVISTIMSIILI